MDKPDFAFPKKVTENASKDLDQAIKDHDAYRALTALVQYFVADNLIDPDRAQTDLQLIEQTAQIFADSPLHGLFDALLANLYTQVYNAARYKYDRRELPLTPLPADITEWSGEQYKARIKELCMSSITGDNARGLGACQIKDYPDLIIASKLVQTYYPTLLDFAYLNVITIAAWIDLDINVMDIYDMAIANSAVGTAPYILWTTDKIYNTAGSNNSTLRAEFEKYADNQYAGYTLSKINISRGIPVPLIEDAIDDDDDDDDDEISRRNPEELAVTVEFKRWLYTEIGEYLKRFPSTPFKDELSANRETLAAGRVECTFPNLCAVNQPFSVVINNDNANAYQIRVYKIKDGEISRGPINILDIVNSRQPIQTIEIKSAYKVPFACDTTEMISLGEPGYYAVIPFIDGKKIDKNEYAQITRCLSVYPVTLSGCSDGYIVVTDPETGQPIKDAKIVVKETNKNTALASATTNALGYAKLDVPKDRWYNLRYFVTVKGKTYTFTNLSLYINSPSEQSLSYTASIMTDRSIYHFGETVRAMAVVTQSQTNDEHKLESSPSHDVDIEMILKDANGQRISSVKGKTDAYGRVTAEFELPADGLSGNFTISVYGSGKGNIGSRNVMVSDYRMPDFEVTVTEVAHNVPGTGDVTIKGNTKTYSGMSLGGVNITAVVSGRTWSYWRDNSQKLYSTSVTTDAEGNFEFIVPDSMFKANETYTFFSATIDAESPSGSSAQTRTAFSTGKQYLITLTGASGNIDGQAPFTPTVTVTAPDGSVKDLAVKWTLKKGLKTVADGICGTPIDLSRITPGNYTFVVETADPTLADAQMSDISIYNTSTNIIPGESPIWVKDNRVETAAGTTVDLLYGTGKGTTYVYTVITDGNKQILDIANTKVSRGYHTLPIDTRGTDGDIYVTMMCVKDCRTYIRTITVSTTTPQSLTIVGESFRDRLIPGTPETWQIKIVNRDGTPVSSALVLDMYNKALEALLPHNLSLYFRTSSSYNTLRTNNLSSYNITNTDYINIRDKYTDFTPPTFELYGWEYSGHIMVRGNGMYLSMSASPRMKGSSAPMAALSVDAEESTEFMYDSVAPTASADCGVTEEAEQETEPEVDYRESEVPVAVWAPMLTTDDQGQVTYTFTVPNANTTWRLRALAWSNDMQIGTLMRDFVASKPVMVQPNLPRFLRMGDRATVLALVMNNSDQEQTVNTVIELFNPLTNEIIMTQKHNDTIAPNATATVGIDIDVDDCSDAIGYRVRVSNGAFTDGEQSVIRILPNEARLVETQPFYLNTGETVYTTRLPKEKDARISLTFCENPTWTIVTALPGLRTQICDYANSAAAAIYSAAIADGIMQSNPAIGRAINTWRTNPTDSALVSMLEQNQELKIALLNSTPWVQAGQSDTERMANLALLFDKGEISKSVNNAISILQDLQNSDGGWKWGKWCTESSVWVTSNVLAMMANLKTLGWMPDDRRLNDMIVKALRYLDKNVKDTDMVYTIIRPQFTDVTISSNGMKVITATIADIRKNWKDYADPSLKAMAAQALYINKDHKLARELMRSISEFGVFTKDQGFRFPSINALYTYAIVLQAYAMIEPQSRELDGLRQQLIVRKQATDWGNAVVTTEVVQGILSSGSQWLVDAQGASIQVGNTEIMPNGPIETATGRLTANLSQYAGKELKITTTGATPAYGAVYAQFDKPMSDVKAAKCDDLDIEKVLYVRRGTTWEVADKLEVGDRVKVQLTIHARRNMSYVTIIDERPAAFAPVEQLPGWLWSEGVGFYRENRDSQTEMHVVYMRPGTYLLTYEMNVGIAGTFASGVATIQSQYAPELTAHSSGTVLKIK